MIHIRGCWRVPEKRSDVRVSEAKAAAIHADLTSTKLEKKFADEFVEKHNQRIRQNAEYRQTGETA